MANRRTSPDNLEIAVAFVLVLFLGFVFQLAVSPNFWGRLGIMPRTMTGLIGIAFSPLLHGSWAHLTANSVPLFVLLLLLFGNRRYEPKVALTMIWLASGFGTWLIGRGGTIHIGASSVVFGLVSYLIAAGFLMKSWRAALIAAVVFFLFGGIFYGVLPRAGPISWEGHLCGAVAGVWAARRIH